MENKDLQKLDAANKKIKGSESELLKQNDAKVLANFRNPHFNRVIDDYLAYLKKSAPEDNRVLALEKCIGELRELSKAAEKDKSEDFLQDANQVLNKLRANEKYITSAQQLIDGLAKDYGDVDNPQKLNKNEKAAYLKTLDENQKLYTDSVSQANADTPTNNAVKRVRPLSAELDEFSRLPTTYTLATNSLVENYKNANVNQAKIDRAEKLQQKATEIVKTADEHAWMKIVNAAETAQSSAKGTVKAGNSDESVHALKSVNKSIYNNVLMPLLVRIRDNYIAEQINPSGKNNKELISETNALIDTLKKERHFWRPFSYVKIGTVINELNHIKKNYLNNENINTQNEIKSTASQTQLQKNVSQPMQFNVNAQTSKRVEFNTKTSHHSMSPASSWKVGKLKKEEDEKDKILKRYGIEQQKDDRADNKSNAELISPRVKTSKF